jgi:hypothetical protein
MLGPFVEVAVFVFIFMVRAFCGITMSLKLVPRTIADAMRAPPSAVPLCCWREAVKRSDCILLSEK